MDLKSRKRDLAFTSLLGSNIKSINLLPAQMAVVYLLKILVLD